MQFSEETLVFFESNQDLIIRRITNMAQWILRPLTFDTRARYRDDMIQEGIIGFLIFFEKSRVMKSSFRCAQNSMIDFLRRHGPYRRSYNRVLARLEELHENTPCDTQLRQEQRAAMLAPPLPIEAALETPSRDPSCEEILIACDIWEKLGKRLSKREKKVLENTALLEDEAATVALKEGISTLSVYQVKMKARRKLAPYRARYNL